MADIKISELEPTTDLEGLYTIGSDKNNLSKKVSLQFLKDAANYANEQGDYAKQAGDTVNGNVGVSDYPEFSASKSYVIGDIVRYNGVLYSFTANHAASAWNGSDVKATSINAITSGKLTELESEVVNVNPSVNLLDNAKLLLGKYITSEGGIGTLENYNASDFIKVKENCTYYCSKESKEGFRFVCCYDKEKNVLVSSIADVKNFTTPLGCQYVRVSFKAAETNIAQVCEEYRNYVPYNPIGGYVRKELLQIEKNTDDISKVIDLANVIGQGEIIKNKANPNEGKEGYYFNGSWVENVALDATGYINVEYGKTYALFPKVTLTNINNNLMRFVALFDENKNFINALAELTKVTIESDNVKYMIVSFYNRENPNVERKRTINDIAIGDIDVISSYVEYKKEVYAYLKNPSGTTPDSIVTREDISNSKNCGVLWGKKWVACGDSYTEGDFASLANVEDYKFLDNPYIGENKVYPFFIGRRNNMTIVNEAKSGSTMTYFNGNLNEFSTPNGRYTKIPKDADYITLYFGINDENQQVEIGNIEDMTNTTFYGAWNIVMSYLLKNHPNAKIGIIITNNCTRDDIITAEINIARKYGIRFLNFANDDSLSYIYRQFRRVMPTEIRTIYDNRYRVSDTNTHPNAAMHERESYIIEDWLRSL